MPALKPTCSLAAGWLLAGCASQANPYYDAAKPHHTPQGLRNNDIASVARPFSDLLKWRIEAIRDGVPKPPREATALVQCGGLNVLTDPVLSERASPLSFAGPKRAQPPGIALADLAEAVQAHRDLGARRSIGVHWGTFALTDESLDQPPRDLAAARKAMHVGADEFPMLKVGETRWFSAK